MPKKQKNLLVEYQINVMGLVNKLLVDAGYDVDYAVTATSAVQKAKAEKYDLGIIGLLLPDSSGIELITLMKNRKCCCKYVMVVSNMYNCHLGLELMDLGVTSYLQRDTLTPEVFLTEVAKTLAGKGSIEEQIKRLVERDGEESCEVK